MVTDDEVRAELGSLVGEIDLMLSQGAELGDPVFDETLYRLVTFWIQNKDKVKFCYWWGLTTNTKSIVDCYTIKG